eukprot:CAMPEP_0170141788 /NCGR_PEP_ID=MMETSP0033_2-20121228/7224_1 /TAXON_ID=195969 /ORGANISM="Dolichomastix tenuilepis, Strain CCMP3274" /LENGTH=346 /DNA_ID=CAMNT_0010378075 /DNA_START=17 /DNA_END=1057 /DNA_ORIENTATION=-
MTEAVSSAWAAETGMLGGDGQSTVPAAPAAPAAEPSAPAEQAPETATLEDAEVMTVFVSNFPPDVKERELTNLLRWVPGYVACQMHSKPSMDGIVRPTGFALFSSREYAQAALDKLVGCPFDASYTLRCEMAKKNMLKPVNLGGAPPSSKRPRHTYDGEDGGAATHAQHAPGAQAPPPAAPAGYGAYGAAPQQQAYDPYAGYAQSGYGAYGYGQSGYGGYGGYGSYGGYAGGYGAQPAAGGGGGGPKSSTSNNPPCNTLFVGNLGESVMEAEIHDLFSRYHGFLQIKMVRSSHNDTLAFVQFQDIPTAEVAHDATQNIQLPSCTRGPIRVQYSKSPLGQKRAYGAM